MALVDYLCEAAICLDVTCQQRDDAMRALLEQLAAADMMPEALVDEVLEALLERERLGSTAIGRGVAVPHARLAALDRLVVGFGYSASGVEFHALDGQPVHEVFLVLGPKEGADEYLAVMQHITRLVQNDDFRRFIADAATAAEVIDLFEEMDT